MLYRRMDKVKRDHAVVNEDEGCGSGPRHSCAGLLALDKERRGEIEEILVCPAGSDVASLLSVKEEGRGRESERVRE